MISYVILKYAPYDWLKYRGMAILVCRKKNCGPDVTRHAQDSHTSYQSRSKFNLQKTGGRYHEPQSVNSNLRAKVKSTSSVLFKGLPRILNPFLHNVNIMCTYVGPARQHILYYVGWKCVRVSADRSRAGAAGDITNCISADRKESTWSTHRHCKRSPLITLDRKWKSSYLLDPNQNPVFDILIIANATMGSKLLILLVLFLMPVLLIFLSATEVRFAGNSVT